MKSASVETRDVRARIGHLEALLAEHKETIATHVETIQNLIADNQLLKRSLFGSRRERYTDPAQTLLFDASSLEPDNPEGGRDEASRESLEPPKKRPSRGRQQRVFPDLLPRQEEKHHLHEEDIPDEMRNHPDARRFFRKWGSGLN